MLNRTRYFATSYLRKIGLAPKIKDNFAVRNMLKTIKSLDEKKILFEIEVDENGDWVVESKNIEGIVTGGNFCNKNDNMIRQINDAIFTYFEIPPELCDDSLLIKKQKSEIKEQEKYFAFNPTSVPAV